MKVLKGRHNKAQGGAKRNPGSPPPLDLSPGGHVRQLKAVFHTAHGFAALGGVNSLLIDGFSSMPLLEIPNIIVLKGRDTSQAVNQWNRCRFGCLVPTGLGVVFGFPWVALRSTQGFDVSSFQDYHHADAWLT